MFYFEVSTIYSRASKLYDGYLEVVFYNNPKQESIIIEGFNEITHAKGLFKKEGYEKLNYPKQILRIWKKKLIINQIRSCSSYGTFIAFSNGDIMRIYLTDVKGEIEEVISIENVTKLLPLEKKSFLEMFNKADEFILSLL
ncbi:hypothetical protein QNI19_34585 [Cytophagaceae bacterium DM2B3-1]|uniref:Uncharacterized protein n=1 Tax=Xanthocytophaga flava TaxID=3048013 RepID=A0ABT7CWI1_9BACT|nr:hypothetical protein [Xanthocytophaga flavus]MDJ1467015.1 hypothetical protein [Xanthocytophaga flavus]MDJ1498121.1 hypothetical protein [Xanthocytophaga flavus]